MEIYLGQMVGMIKEPSVNGRKDIYTVFDITGDLIGIKTKSGGSQYVDKNELHPVFVEFDPSDFEKHWNSEE